MNGQPEPVVIAAVLTNVREIRARQDREPNQLALILWEGEQLHPFTQRQPFASRHRSSSLMARPSQLKYTFQEQRPQNRQARQCSMTSYRLV